MLRSRDWWWSGGGFSGLSRIGAWEVGRLLCFLGPRVDDGVRRLVLVGFERRFHDGLIAWNHRMSE